MRSAVVAAVSILIFGAGALLVVYLATGGPERPASPAAAPAPATAPAPDAPPAPAVPPPGAPDLSRYAGVSGGAPPRPMEYAPAPPPPPEGSWEAVPAVARLSALGPLGRAVHGGLQDLQPRVSECFDRPAPARELLVGPGASDGAGSGATVLALELETGDGEVRIVDAPVSTRGDLDAGVVACAQQVLRGQVFPAPGARPGTRHRVLHPLIQ
jgi:hypothetical protein